MTADLTALRDCAAKALLDADNWAQLGRRADRERFADAVVTALVARGFTLPSPEAAPTPHSDPTETEEERADRLETERDHAAGDHTYCGHTCEVEFPTEHLRNFVVAKGYPGTERAFDELLRRSREEGRRIADGVDWKAQYETEHARHVAVVGALVAARGALLRGAADDIDRETQQLKDDGVLEPDKFRPCRDATADLRRRADEMEQEAGCPGCGCAEHRGFCDACGCLDSRTADEVQQGERPACTDPIECTHEAALGQAEESLKRVREVINAIDAEMRTEPDTQRSAMQLEAVHRISAALKGDGAADEAQQAEYPRGDQFEVWLKAQRDASADHPEAYQAADGLLDLYRLHVDTGTPLGEPVCECRGLADCDCREQKAGDRA